MLNPLGRRDSAAGDTHNKKITFEKVFGSRLCEIFYRLLCVQYCKFKTYR